MGSDAIAPTFDPLWCMRILGERASFAVAYVSRDGHVEFVSPGFAALLGFEATMPLPAPLAALADSPLRDHLSRVVPRACASTVRVVDDFTLSPERPAEVRSVRIEVHPEVREGNARGALVLVVDRGPAGLTEMPWTSDHELALAIDFAPTAIAVGDLGGTIRCANRAFSKLFGYEPGEIVGRNVPTQLTHPEDAERDRDELAELLGRSDSGYTRTKRYVRKDGSVFEARVQVSIVRDRDGTPRYLVGQVQDECERLSFEQRLAQTDRLASIGTLAAGVAHEVNNPLAYVMTNLDLLAEELHERGSDPSLLQLVAEALEGTERVRTIVRGLKTFARHDSEAIGAVDLHHVLDVARSMTAAELRHRAVVELELGEIPLVEANETALTQVFVNLLMNAVEALPERRLDRNRILLRTRWEDERVVVEVVDNGRGVPAELAGRVFEPFFTTRAVGRGGAGLGLSIAHGIISSLSGTIELESRVGLGTTVRVTLPRAISEPGFRPADTGEYRMPPLDASPEAPGPAASIHGAPRRAQVLLIDDDAILARSLARVLGRQHEVTTTTTGQQGLELALARPFDAIVCDLMMPGVSGAELYRTLSARRPEAASRMIFMSGGAYSDVARTLLETIDNPCIDKPVDVELLDKQIRSVAGLSV